MINCNCFNDWDYSLLVLNEVSEPYLTLWIDYYLSIRNHMTKSMYVAVMRMIMHYRKQLLCRLPWRTAKARKADGKDLCRQPRTAKGSGKEGYGKQLLCRLLPGGGRQRAFGLCRPPYDVMYTSLDGRFFAVCHWWQSAGSLPSATDGKVFAVCHCRQTDQMGQLPGSTVGCHVASLPSAADGKGSLPSVADGKEPAYCLFFLFFIKSHNLQHISHI